MKFAKRRAFARDSERRAELIVLDVLMRDAQRTFNAGALSMRDWVVQIEALISFALPPEGSEQRAEWEKRPSVLEVEEET